jgi:NMD protein affecting ribosome stability and mRNA decay
MKLRNIGHRQPPAAIHVAPRGARADRTPPVALRAAVEREPTMCERCGAVYLNKTWRAGERTSRTSLVGVGWTLCPACAQVEDAEYFGRIRVTAPLAPERELEVRRRIWRVEGRARHTQPERRTVRIDRGRAGLEILTTSQKLAHRIARELEKAFGGRAHYTWTDREGALDATWTPPAAAATARPARPAARRPRIKRRSLAPR